ncbi:MAG: protein tyrosine phosphatase family protein [Thiobacillus sp.]
MGRLDSIRNVLRVSERIVSSGQPTATQLADIAAAGFDAVINLAMPDSDGALADEAARVEALGLGYVSIPVPYEAPERHHLEAFFAAMNALAGRRVWVHCALNWRASAFLYLYHRRVLGLPPESARRAMWPAWKPDAIWQAFLDSHDPR